MKNIKQLKVDLAGQVGENAIWDGPLSKEGSEEHTSELQSRLHLVCRLLLEKTESKSSPMKLPATRIMAAARTN